MPPIIILPLALLQGTAPPVLTVSPPPAPPVIYRAPAPPPAPPAPSTGARGPSPRGNPASWATSADYPSRMLRMEVEGKTAFRVIVNDSGRVSHCEITESSGATMLDEATCRLITRRARFNPATDRRGTLVEGAYSSAVRWQIPQEDPLLKPSSSVSRMVVEADGQSSSCSLERTEPLLNFAIKPCPLERFRTNYADRRSSAVRRSVTITVTTSITDAE